MEEHWELEIGEDEVKIRSAMGTLATLAYPITEAGTMESTYIMHCARLMVAAPDLFQGLQMLLGVVEDHSADGNQLKDAVHHAREALAKAQQKQ